MATTITTFKKSQLGVEDVHFDSAGSGATANTPTSTSGTRQVRKLNASHIPTTTATRAKTDAAGTTLTETSVDDTLQQLLDDNALQGVPDGTSVEVSAGSLQIVAGGVTATELATDAVEEAKIKALAVTTGKIALLAVDTGQLAVDAVENSKIAALAVDTAELAAGAVENDKIADGTIKAVKMLNAPTHFIVGAEEITSTTTGTTSLIFTTATAIGASDILQVTAKSFGTGPVTMYSASRTGANQVTAVVDANQTAGTTTLFLTVLGAVTV